MRQLAEVVQFEGVVGKAIEEYLNEKGLRSENTKKNKRADIERFLDSMLNKSIKDVTVSDIEKIDYNTMINYRDTLLSEDLSNASVNRYMNSIKTLMDDLKARGDILSKEYSTLFMSRLTKLPESTESIERMPVEVVDQYIKRAKEDKHNGELKANLIEFATDTGLRLEEVLNIKLSQFTVDGDVVLLKGYGKGNEKYFDKISVELYNKMLSTFAEEGNTDRKLFYPLSAKVVKTMMKRFQSELGYEDKVYSFHSLKKTAVTNTYRQTGCMLSAQKKGRHKDLNTTKKYIEEEDFGITGVYSMRAMGYNENAYKEASHEELLEVIGEMNKDFLHILNMKLNNRKNK